MVTLQQLPEELKSFLFEHNLLQSPALVGEHQADVQIALTRITEVVMSGLAELAGQKSGRDVVWSSAREASEADATAGYAAATVAAPRGAGLIKSVLIDRYHGTVNTIVQANGLKPSSVSHLIDLVTGAALELIGGLVAEHHWDAQQLANWLRPRQFAAPIPVVAPLPLPSVAAVPAAVEAASWFARPANLLLVALSVVAAGEFGYIMNTWSGAAPTSVAAVAAPAAVAMPNPGVNKGQYTAIPVANLPKATDAARGKAAVPVVLKLKDGARQIIGANSTESKLYQFLIDPSKEVDMVDPTKDWIGFDRIYFEPNKATLTNESLWQLSNVASILKRFPAAKIKIGGYTDNSGNPLLNLQLSKERAQATLASLVSLGVPAERLAAAGYGALDNIATNDTEEGRSLNRRVSMQVSQK